MNRRMFLRRSLAAACLSTVLPSRVFAGQTGYTLTFLGSLSGPGAAFAHDALDGISLGLKDLGYRLANQEVRVVVEDDKGRPGAALEAARRLVTGETSDIVVTSLWPSALAQAAPVFEQAGTFVINVGPAPQALSDSLCNPWFFDLTGEEDGVHEAAGAAMMADQVKRVLVVGQDRPATTQAIAALSRSYQGEILEALRLGEGAATFPSALQTIAAQLGESGGAVYMLLGGGQGVAFMRAWGKAGQNGKTRLYAPWRGFESTYLSAMGSGAIGATVIGTWNGDFDAPQNKRLVTEFEAEYGRVPSTWSAEGYDAVSLLDTVTRQLQGKPADPEALRSAIRHADFPSTRGQLKFNLNHFPVMTYWRFQIGRDSRGRLVREAKGPVLKDWRGHGGQCPMRWDDQLQQGGSKQPATKQPGTKPPVTKQPGAKKTL